MATHTHTCKHIERIRNAISITIPIAIQLKEFLFCLCSLMLLGVVCSFSFISSSKFAVTLCWWLILVFSFFPNSIRYLDSRHVCPLMFVFVLVIMLFFLMCLLRGI